jgi:light-regulated signal transduction histidine kinase (bacteriophytochrome)
LPLQQATRGKEVRDYEMDLVFADGTVKAVVGNATPLRDENGNPQGGIAVLTDVTQRKLAGERIRRLNEGLEQRAGELEVANEELERLATSLALDLRSPLVSIHSLSHVIAQDYGAQLPPQAQQLFQLIHANAEEMEELTQGLLQLMHVTRQTLRKQELNPEEIVRAAWAELQPEREGRQVELAVGGLPPCVADPLLLKQVWSALLSNALQATRDKQQACIEVGARPEEKRMVYFVKDNGMGFDMSYAGTIFRAFQRYHRPEEWAGSGVGLAVVDTIIRRHGGRVWAEGAVNEGATFNFEV